MSEDSVAEAWVELESDEEVLAAMPKGVARPYDYGFVSGMLKLLRAHRRIAAKFWPLFHEVMIAPGSLTRREREMIAVVCAAAQDCTY